MKSGFATGLAGLVFCFAVPAHADAEVQDAVKHVQGEMQQPGFAKASAEDSPQAKKTYEQVHALAGGSDKDTDAVYGLAADVLGNMKDMTPEQMQQFLEKAQKDPQGFADSLTPEQKAKLQGISQRLPSGDKPAVPATK